MDDLVADVIDEEDATPAKWIRKDTDGSLVLDGKVTLAELAEDHGVDLEHPDVVTVAGLFLAERGTVPGVGDAIEVNGRRLVVEEMAGMKVVRVRLHAPG